MPQPIDADTLAKITSILLSGNPIAYDFYMKYDSFAQQELREVIALAKIIILECQNSI